MTPVEKVAKAIESALQHPPPEAMKGSAKLQWIDPHYVARAAIEALREASDGMIEAGEQAYLNARGIYLRDLYRTMIDAALDEGTVTPPA